MGYCCQFATVKLFFASIGIRHGEARRLRGGEKEDHLNSKHTVIFVSVSGRKDYRLKKKNVDNVAIMCKNRELPKYPLTGNLEQLRRVTC